MTINPTILSNLMLVFAAFGAAFLAALWLSLVVWTYRDSRNRARDHLIHILAAIMVALISLPGVLIYLVLRPKLTLEEEYQRTLEEEALLQAIEDQSVCPGCERRIEENWQICPNCHTKLKKPCQHCEILIELSWNICPFCATPVPGLRADNLESIDFSVNGVNQEGNNNLEVTSFDTLDVEIKDDQDPLHLDV